MTLCLAGDIIIVYPGCFGERGGRGKVTEQKLGMATGLFSFLGFSEKQQGREGVQACSFTSSLEDLCYSRDSSKKLTLLTLYQLVNTVSL